MTTKRLFLALNATNPLAETFQPTFKKLKINADRRDITVKWVPLDNFHITLSFLGDRYVEEIPHIAHVLKQVCEQTAPFELKIEDLSAFSSETEARVLWLGVQNKKCLGELKHDLDEALLQAEILDHPDQRIFQPHLTIGRLRNPRSVKDMISPFKRKSFGKLQVNEVVLYESRQQGVYQVYTPLLRCPLTGRFELTEEESTAASF